MSLLDNVKKGRKRGKRRPPPTTAPQEGGHKSLWPASSAVGEWKALYPVSEGNPLCAKVLPPPWGTTMSFCPMVPYLLPTFPSLVAASLVAGEIGGPAATAALVVQPCWEMMTVPFLCKCGGGGVAVYLAWLWTQTRLETIVLEFGRLNKCGDEDELVA